MTLDADHRLTGAQRFRGESLRHFRRSFWTTASCEGRTSSSVILRKAWDQGIVLGGASARDPLEGEGVERIAEATRALALGVERIAGDILISARLREW